MMFFVMVLIAAEGHAEELSSTFQTQARLLWNVPGAAL